jgi:hypothetical protein
MLQPSPDLARLRLRSVTLSRKRAREREVASAFAKIADENPSENYFPASHAA